MERVILWLSCILCFFSNSAFANAYQKLLPNERNTIAVFQKAQPNVVFVSRYQKVLNNNYEITNLSSGMGSGVVWNKEGFIVTNYHVVDGAKNLMVTIGEVSVPAEFVGGEPRKDIAVLRVREKAALAKLETFDGLKIANIRALMVGQKALAIGNPFGLSHSLSVGVISALGREVPGFGGVSIRDMIQTDAAINPGNSGGPLLNSDGELIGLNTIIFTKTGGSNGIGFAVPADDVNRIVQQIIRHGRVILAGIGFQQMNPQLSRQLGVNKGVLIHRILRGTPAEKAGLRATYQTNQGRVHLGDVIVGVNGHPVEDYDDLYNVLSELKVGQRVNLKIRRDGQLKSVRLQTIDIAAYP